VSDNPLRVWEAAVVLAWADGIPPAAFVALPEWRHRVYLQDAALCLTEFDALTTPRNDQGSPHVHDA